MALLSRLASGLRQAVPALARDLCGLGGATLISYGAWLAYAPAGFIVGGGFLLAAAWLSAGQTD